MSDEKPAGPLYIKTKEIPKVEVPQNSIDAVLAEMRAMRSETKGELSELKADVRLVGGEVGTLNGRVGLLESRMVAVEDRQNVGSLRVRTTSENDLRQDATIGLIKSDVAAVKKDVEALTKAVAQNNAWTKELVIAGQGFAKAHPQLVNALLTFIGTALGAATMWLAGKGH